MIVGDIPNYGKGKERYCRKSKCEADFNLPCKRKWKAITKVSQTILEASQLRSL